MDSLINPYGGIKNPYVNTAAYSGHSAARDAYSGTHSGSSGLGAAAGTSSNSGRTITDFFGKMMSFSSQSAAMASVLSPPYYSHHAPNPNGPNPNAGVGSGLPGSHNLYGDTKLNSHL